jgi:hypothetical protein
MEILHKLNRYIFRRYYKQRLNEMVAPDYPVLLDYAVNSAHRYGYGRPPHPQLLSILERGRPEYMKRLVALCQLRESLCKISDRPTASVEEPFWGQDWFTTLDAVALYGMLVEFRPKRLIEIGSGNSTKFARRAVRDHSISTRITSIDPAPRAEIDLLCDSVIRSPLEEVDLCVFDELEPGDFLFVDSSHRSFPNSDVTVVFLDVLPRLRAGVALHFHDIFWPRDYPPEWASRYYSEQYLLGCFLLGDHDSTVKILMPNAFIAQDAQLAAICKPLLEIPGVRWLKDSASWPYGIAGGSFWMQVAERMTEKE